MKLTIGFIQEVFDWCVRILVQLGDAIGMTYEEVNVWIFCIIGPIVFIVMFWIIIKQRRKIKNLGKAGRT